MGVTQSEAIQNHCQLNWSSEGCNGIPEFILYCRQLFLYNVGVVNRKKKKEFKYQTARKGRHKERVAKQEKTQPLNQTVNEKNECLPHQKSYCCFWLFGSDHQESTFFFFMSKWKQTFKQCFPGSRPPPVSYCCYTCQAFLSGPGCTSTVWNIGSSISNKRTLLICIYQLTWRNCR